MKTLYAALGVLSVALAIVGVFVPGIAHDCVRDCRVVSLRAELAAARALARGNRWLGPSLQRFRETRGMPRQEQAARAGVDVDGPGPEHLRARRRRRRSTDAAALLGVDRHRDDSLRRRTTAVRQSAHPVVAGGGGNGGPEATGQHGATEERRILFLDEWPPLLRFSVLTRSLRPPPLAPTRRGHA